MIAAALAWLRRRLGIVSPSLAMVPDPAEFKAAFDAGQRESAVRRVALEARLGHPPTRDELIADLLAWVDEHPGFMAQMRRIRDINFPDPPEDT